MSMENEKKKEVRNDSTQFYEENHKFTQIHINKINIGKFFKCRNARRENYLFSNV